jgi:low affinity Fe/Cu permease
MLQPYQVRAEHLGRSQQAPRTRAWVVRREGKQMLETIAIILIVLWLLGMVSGYTLGNFIYILLVIAIVLFLVRLVSGRRVV